MYRLRVQSHFDAAHQLVGYQGKCEKLHGHSWRVEVFIIGEQRDSVGILLDFESLKKKLNAILIPLDHSFLNTFQEIGNPTTENIAQYLFNKLTGLPKNVKLEKIRVWESESSWVEYWKEKH